MDYVIGCLKTEKFRILRHNIQKLKSFSYFMWIDYVVYITTKTQVWDFRPTDQTFKPT